MPLLAPVVHWMTLPARLTVAAAETTLALGQLVDPEGPVRRSDGYADRVMAVIGQGGLIEQFVTTLTDPRGPMRLITAVAAALDPDRPLGQALAPGGAVDRLLDAEGPVFRLLEEGGTVDRLVAVGGPLDRLLAVDGALDRITQQGGVLDRLLVEQGLLDRLLHEDGFLEKLIADGGTLDQLIALGATLERIQPRLGELARLIPELHASVDALNAAVVPLSDLANKLPGRRRAAIEA